jgi:SAM-dependent methyltransferase
MKHVYNDTFFDYINESAHSSARTLIAKLFPMLRPQSVIDLGSGRGVWLAEWQKAGATDVLGVDGDYVDQNRLAVDQASFLAADLTAPVDTGRRFDLAQSLEVGEHLPLEAAQVLVDSLTAASDRVLFSAAVKGQGGEFHVNEQPLAFWQDLFEAKGYRPIDCLRPHLKNDKTAAPWYRYNSILYVNDAGRAGLPDDVLQHALPAGQKVKDGGSLPWRLRKAIVSLLPRNTVTQIAKIRAAIIASTVRLRKSAKPAAA